MGKCKIRMLNNKATIDNGSRFLEFHLKSETKVTLISHYMSSSSSKLSIQNKMSAARDNHISGDNRECLELRR